MHHKYNLIINSIYGDNCKYFCSKSIVITENAEIAEIFLEWFCDVSPNVTKYGNNYKIEVYRR